MTVDVEALAAEIQREIAELPTSIEEWNAKPLEWRKRQGAFLLGRDELPPCSDVTLAVKDDAFVVNVRLIRPIEVVYMTVTVE